MDDQNTTDEQDTPASQTTASPRSAPAPQTTSVGQKTGRLADSDPTGNPANDVYVVSTGINPNLVSQQEAEAALQQDPPNDQIPALDPSAGDEGAAEDAEEERQGRIQAAVEDGQQEDDAKNA